MSQDIKLDIWVKARCARKNLSREIYHMCLLPKQLCKREKNRREMSMRKQKIGRVAVWGGTHLFVNVESSHPWVSAELVTQKGRRRDRSRKSETVAYTRYSGIWGRRWWTRMLKMPVGMRRITPISVMSFGAKWLRTSKGGIFPDGKASSSHPSYREEDLRGDAAHPSHEKRGRWNRRGGLIKINPKHSYFHKLSARRPIRRIGTRTGTLKASALFLAESRFYK